jgi:hypothetical protein
MNDRPIINWLELRRQVRIAAAEAADRAADARRRRDAARERLVELRRGRARGDPLARDAAMSAESAQRAAEIARDRVLAGLERAALAHDHSAEAHDRAAGLATRRGESDRGGWHERAAAQARRDAGEDRARAEELRQAEL